MAKKDAPQEKPKKSPPSKKNTKKPNPPKLEEYYEKKRAAFKEIKKGVSSKPITGRPTKYNQELANYIVKRVASTHLSLKDLCASDDKMPDRSTINEWRWDYPEFSAAYRLAKLHQTELMAEECEEISKELEYTSDQSGCSKVDPGFIASRRLIVDTKKWHTSKLNPTVFGDRKAVEALQGENEQIKAELMALKLQLSEVNKKEY